MLSNRRSTMMVPQQTAAQIQAEMAASAEPTNLPSSMLTATTETLPGFRIKMIMGAVKGSSVHERPKPRKNSTASGFLRKTVSQEARHLTHAIYDARNEAQERMELCAVSMGANAIIGVSFDQSELMGCVQCSVWGTAVFVERIREDDSV
ncbi:hypothetical protein PpBr36_00870 [Pyricularia pennisetigena]|uniref:hypothetical protein n=1 Tax=Pyricularia pennisetigena TaxID=1578925 RepID=UPI0011501839|nr:hypothetical protein PpBr36_00870 [Pyricularia pennisetigena]TLS29618.1 hypothetical protein PpBr36_00870 [Pyricularia pennisetigena]